MATIRIKLGNQEITQPFNADFRKSLQEKENQKLVLGKIGTCYVCWPPVKVQFHPDELYLTNVSDNKDHFHRSFDSTHMLYSCLLPECKSQMILARPYPDLSNIEEYRGHSALDENHNYQLNVHRCRLPDSLL